MIAELFERERRQPLRLANRGETLRDVRRVAQRAQLPRVPPVRLPIDRAERSDGLVCVGTERHAGIGDDAHLDGRRVGRQQQIASRVFDDQILIPRDDPLAERVRDWRLPRLVQGFRQPDLRFEELSLAIDDRHQHDGHVEELRRETREAVEGLLGWRVEQVRPLEGAETIRASELAVRRLHGRRQRRELPHGVGDVLIRGRGTQHRCDAPAREFLTSAGGRVSDDDRGHQRRARVATQLLHQLDRIGERTAIDDRERLLRLGTLHGLGDRAGTNHAPAVGVECPFERAGVVIRFDEEHELGVGGHKIWSLTPKTSGFVGSISTMSNVSTTKPEVEPRYSDRNALKGSTRVADRAGR